MKNDFSYLCLKHRYPAYGGSANTPVPGIALYTQDLLLCLPLPFAGLLPCRERASHSALRVRFVVFFMYFLSHLVSMLGL